MDYESIHGPGVSNFSSSSPHRMPTVSAAQALQDLKASPTRCISTGLVALDFALQNKEASVLSEAPSSSYCGVSRGKVTEIYGPPGIGKTALGMQLTASALHAGENVAWVDASHPVSGLRFFQILDSFHSLGPVAETNPSSERNSSNLLDNLVHFSTPTLAHLLALFSHSTPNHPIQNCGLVIIDSFSTLFTTAFPRSVNNTSTPKKPGAPNPSARKFPILQHVINTLQKLAATRNLAVVVFSQCVTKMRPGLGAVLVPSISTTAWEQGLGCRVVLFRDWGWTDEDGNRIHDVRLAQVIKAEGLALPDSRGRLAGFTITETGIQSLPFPSSSSSLSNHLPALHLPHPNSNFAPRSNPNFPPSTSTTPTVSLPQKRKLSATDLEIPDSEGEDDEDYGWAEEDEEDIPVMPPQWQGSEDILIPPPGELEAEDEGENGDEEEGAVEEQNHDNEEGGVDDTERGNQVIVDDSEDELAL